MRTPSELRTKPTGSAASCGIVKGLKAISPIENGSPARKYSTAGNHVGSRFKAGISAEAWSSDVTGVLGSALVGWDNPAVTGRQSTSASSGSLSSADAS